MFRVDDSERQEDGYSSKLIDSMSPKSVRMTVQPVGILQSLRLGVHGSSAIGSTTLAPAPEDHPQIKSSLSNWISRIAASLPCWTDMCDSLCSQTSLSGTDTLPDQPSVADVILDVQQRMWNWQCPK